MFDVGYFIGKLGRGKVAVLNRGDVEKPSDVSGVLYIPYPDGNWQISLARIGSYSAARPRPSP